MPTESGQKLSAKKLLAAHPHVETVMAMFADGNGVLRGKILPVDMLDKLLKDGVMLPASVFASNIMGETVAETGLLWENGDADCPWQALPETFHILPDTDGRKAALLIQLLNDDGSPNLIDPRSVLQGVVARLNAMDIYPVIAPELEFYMIAPKTDSSGMGVRAIAPLTGQEQPTNNVYGIEGYEDFAPILDDIKSVCTQISVGADTAITEYGRSQFEINLAHQDDPVRACDEAVLLRRMARLVARQHGHDVTFMGKPFGDDTGSGFHLHVSLLDKKGHNIMAEGDGEDMLKAKNLRHAAAGMGRYLADGMAVFAPNPNAWRRLQPGHYAPMGRSWGYNNRTVSFRIPMSDAKSRRLEHRCSAADANPYLATAIILASMAEGIKHKLNPPEATTGNAYDNLDLEGIPQSWAEANRIFMDSAFIRDWLGEACQRVFGETKENERRQFETIITPLEWKWYR